MERRGRKGEKRESEEKEKKRQKTIGHENKVAKRYRKISTIERLSDMLISSSIDRKIHNRQTDGEIHREASE